MRLGVQRISLPKSSSNLCKIIFSRSTGRARIASKIERFSVAVHHSINTDDNGIIRFDEGKILRINGKAGAEISRKQDSVCAHSLPRPGSQDRAFTTDNVFNRIRSPLRPSLGLACALTRLSLDYSFIFIELRHISCPVLCRARGAEFAWRAELLTRPSASCAAMHILSSDLDPLF